MARPPVLQKLKHGKLLTGGAFRFFVETWNWLVGYTDNLKGDADLNAANGHAIVDRSDPDHPVIRIVNLPRGGGGKTITIVGNDDGETEVTCLTGRVQFASASDSNVVVTPSADLDGNVTLTVGVYYA